METAGVAFSLVLKLLLAYEVKKLHQQHLVVIKHLFILSASTLFYVA